MFRRRSDKESISLFLCRRLCRGEPGAGFGSGGEPRLRPDGGRRGQAEKADLTGPDVRGGHAETAPEEVRVQTTESFLKVCFCVIPPTDTGSVASAAMVRCYVSENDFLILSVH